MIKHIKTKSVIAVAAVLSLMACNQMDLPVGQEPNFTEGQKASLEIKVSTSPVTKALSETGIITSNGLPKESEIGVFLTDDSGVTYDGISYDNILYRNEETDEFGTILSFFKDNWLPYDYSNAPYLSATKGTLYSYYPYSSSNTDITRIPVFADPSIGNIDIMYGTPVTDLDQDNKEAVITMNHALSFVILNIDRGYYDGKGNISHTYITSESAAHGAILNAKDGTLSTFIMSGQQFDNYDEVNIDEVEMEQVGIMVVPTGVSAPLSIGLVLDDMIYTGEFSAVTFESGKIYKFNVTIAAEGLVIQKVTVDEWDTVNLGYYDEFVNDNLFSDYPLTSNYDPEVGIIDKYNNVYLTVEEWNAAKEAGKVTNADACGVYLTGSQMLFSPHIIHPKKSPTTLKWSNDKTVVVPGATDIITFSENFIETYIERLQYEIGQTLPEEITDEIVLELIATIMYFDVNGEDNTNAILAAVADGTIPDAPAAQYCVETVFANGLHGYLPAAGQVMAWNDYRDIINEAMLAIGGDPIDENEKYWSSTQSGSENALHMQTFAVQNLDKTNVAYARPVTYISLF